MALRSAKKDGEGVESLTAQDGGRGRIKVAVGKAGGGGGRGS